MFQADDPPAAAADAPDANNAAAMLLIQQQMEALQKQVWPLRQFFPVSFFCKKKSEICLDGKSMNHLRGNPFLFHSSQQLPRLRL